MNDVLCYFAHCLFVIRKSFTGAIIFVHFVHLMLIEVTFATSLYKIVNTKETKGLPSIIIYKYSLQKSILPRTKYCMANIPSPAPRPNLQSSASVKATPAIAAMAKQMKNCTAVNWKKGSALC